MIRIYITYSLLLIMVITSCKAQKKDLKQESMKIFDIERFNKNKVQNTYNFITKDSTIIEQYENYGEYFETIKFKNNYFQLFNRYRKNGILKLTGEFFPEDFQKGIWKEYDEQGKLIKETDYDKPYIFTFEDILKLIKKRNIDMTTYHFSIIRNVVDDVPMWSIIYETEARDKKHVISINGITGKIKGEYKYDYPTPD